MAPMSAANLVLLGGALLLLDGRRRSARVVVEILCIIAFLIGLMSCVGYAYGVEFLYGPATFAQMAVHSAATFVLLSVGILFARDHGSLAALFRGDTLGSLMVRRLLPAAIVLPFLLGWLRLWGQQAGLYDVKFGLAIYAMSQMVIFGALTWWTAYLLRQAEAQRLAAEEELRHSVEDLARSNACCRRGARCSAPMAPLIFSLRVPHLSDG